MRICIEKYNTEIKLNKVETALFKNIESQFIEASTTQIKVKSSFFDDTKKVNDCWRYIMKFVGDKNKFYLHDPNEQICSDFTSVHDQSPLNIKNNYEKIVIILESPHKDEYDQNFSPIAPANGESGENIHKYLISHVIPLLIGLGLKLDKEAYNIIICNPVPYQTSLVNIHGQALVDTLRNKIWKLIYPFCKSDFESRILSYKPKILINACTSNIKKTLQIVANEYEIYETSHPCAWAIGLGAFKKT